MNISKEVTRVIRYIEVVGVPTTLNIEKLKAASTAGRLIAELVRSSFVLEDAAKDAAEKEAQLLLLLSRELMDLASEVDIVGIHHTGHVNDIGFNL